MKQPDDGWFKSENIRLEMIGSPERWMNRKGEKWERVGIGKNHVHAMYEDKDRYIIPNHVITRIYERTDIDMTHFKRWLDNIDLEDAAWKEDERGPCKLYHYRTEGINYAVIFRPAHKQKFKGYSEDCSTWVIATIVIPKMFKDEAKYNN